MPTQYVKIGTPRLFVFSLVSFSEMIYNTIGRVEGYSEKESAKHYEKPSFQEKTRFPVSDVAEWGRKSHSQQKENSL